MYFRSVTLATILVALAATSSPTFAQDYYGGNAAAPPSSASAIAPSAAPTANYGYPPLASGAIPTVTAGPLPPPTATMYPGYGGNSGPGGPMKVVVTHNGQEYTVTVPAVPGLTDIPCCGERDGVDPSDNGAEGTFCRQLRAELAKVPACASLGATGAIEADLIEEDEDVPPAAGTGTEEPKPAVQPVDAGAGGKTEEKKPADGAAGNGQQVQAASASSGLSHFQVSGAKLLKTVGAGLVVAGAVMAM